MDSAHFGISPLLIRTDATGSFPVFLKRRTELVLYTKADECFTVRHKTKLVENGIDTVFIHEEHRSEYEAYVRDNLASILNDVSIPSEERGAVLYDNARSVLRSSFAQEIAGPFRPESYEIIADLVKQSVDFLSTPDGLKALSPLIRRDYETYTHCLHTFAYSTAVLADFGLTGDDLFNCGIGALLHDVGKAGVPASVLKKPGPLTPDERLVIQTHPLQGVTMLSGLDLPREAFNNVLFHHERMDGNGYPSSMAGEDIPLPVRVLTACDVYDALSSDRCYASAAVPFEALSMMRDQMLPMFDVEVFKRLVGVLSSSGITE